MKRLSTVKQSKHTNVSLPLIEAEYSIQDAIDSVIYLDPEDGKGTAVMEFLDELDFSIREALENNSKIAKSMWAVETSVRKNKVIVRIGLESQRDVPRDIFKEVDSILARETGQRKLVNIDSTDPLTHKKV